MQKLIEKEIETNKNEKMSKPDFSSRVGRDFLAFYLLTKFKQIIAYDKKSESPIIKYVNPTFINRFLRRLVNNPQKRIMIAITGESASGKTTICNNIKSTLDKLNMDLSIFSTDNYFNDISELIKIHKTFDNLRDSGYDVDSPDNFQLKLLYNDLVSLSEGFDVKIPEYILDGRGISKPEAIGVKSTKIIVAEGVATMYGNVKDIFDVKIYIDIDKKTQKKWFLERAVSRNQDNENALKHFEYIQKASEKYIIPNKEDADIIINGAADLDYFGKIIEYIYTVTNVYQ